MLPVLKGCRAPFMLIKERKVIRIMKRTISAVLLLALLLSACSSGTRNTVVPTQDNDVQEKQSIFYEDFPDVPDFGLFAEIELAEKTASGDYTVYTYDISGIDEEALYEVAEAYGELIAKWGFLVKDTSETKQKLSNGDTEFLLEDLDEKVLISLKSIEPPEWLSLYQKVDDYSKYTTPDPLNSLDGTLLQLECIVEIIHEAGFGFAYTVSENGNQWLIASSGQYEKMPIHIGNTITVFGAYLGISEDFNNHPALIITRLLNGNAKYYPVYVDDVYGEMLAAAAVEGDQESFPSGDPEDEPDANGTLPDTAVAPAGATASQANAIKSAKQYLSFSPYSYLGIIEQLEFDKYTHEDAVYAADNCGADWRAQALKSAKRYIEYSAFSNSGLIYQLEYEKFTSEQAKYGADNCGADWMEQAVKSAKEYLEYMPFTKEKLIDQLVYDGYTKEQAEHGAKENGL
jgi:hypothetical protein